MAKKKEDEEELDSFIQDLRANVSSETGKKFTQDSTEDPIQRINEERAYTLEFQKLSIMKAFINKELMLQLLNKFALFQKNELKAITKKHIPFYRQNMDKISSEKDFINTISEDFFNSCSSFFEKELETLLKEKKKSKNKK